MQQRFVYALHALLVFAPLPELREGGGKMFLRDSPADRIHFAGANLQEGSTNLGGLQHELSTLVGT